MKLEELCKYLDNAIPVSFQESYDNSGLQVGFPGMELSAAMLTIDVTPQVLEEAGSKGCNLVISHHPVIFNGIKKITGGSTAEKILVRAIKEDIAIYSAHTNLDAASFGVSRKITEKLDLQDVKVLVPLKGKILKLVTFIPASHAEKVSKAVFEAGAGVTGNYDQCGFTVEGTGSFRAGENASPFVGEKGLFHFEKEIRFETIMFSHSKERVIRALKEAHPYEEVAYDLYTLDNDNISEGMGCAGSLRKGMTEESFIQHVATVFGADGIRFSKPTGKDVTKVAVCGGSGASLISAAVASGADAFITADIKYHTFADAENKILLVDVGHFESEKFTTEILYDLIIKKFPKFAVRFSETNTNPINYF